MQIDSPITNVEQHIHQWKENACKYFYRVSQPFVFFFVFLTYFIPFSVASRFLILCGVITTTHLVVFSNVVGQKAGPGCPVVDDRVTLVSEVRA